MITPPIVPQRPKDRFDVYRFFNGISEEGKTGLDGRHTRIPLVKTFLLEHVAARSGRVPRCPTEILGELGAETQPLDEEFHEVRVWEKRDGDSRPQRRTVRTLRRCCLSTPWKILEMTDGVFGFLGRRRQKGMRDLVRHSVLQRIQEYGQERFEDVIKFTGGVLRVSFPGSLITCGVRRKAGRLAVSSSGTSQVGWPASNQARLKRAICAPPLPS